jgi:hypothetical protein
MLRFVDLTDEILASAVEAKAQYGKAQVTPFRGHAGCVLAVLAAAVRASRRFFPSCSWADISLPLHWTCNASTDWFKAVFQRAEL